MGAENVKAAKEFLGWPSQEEFHVPEEVKKHLFNLKVSAMKEGEKWGQLFENYSREYPQEASEYKAWQKGEVPKCQLDNEEFWKAESKPNATRAVSGEVLNRAAAFMPNLIGDSADLAPSTKTYMKDKGDFSPESHSGANLHFGVREYVGMDGEVISIDHFGESAPAEEIFKKYGFTVENVLDKAMAIINRSV